MWVVIHKDVGLSTYIYIGTFWHQKLQICNYKLQHASFTDFVSYQFLLNVFLVGDFDARTNTHQGHDLHSGANGINLLEAPIQYWLRVS